MSKFDSDFEPSNLLRAYSVRAKKRFGQHFLTDAGMLDRIVVAAGVRAGERVLEIGPGCGTLTSRLLHAGAKVTAIEIDRDAAEFLRHTFDGLDLELIEGDALRWPFEELEPRPVRVAANLPYNVGTRVLFRLLESDLRLDRIAVMLQREVANRLVAVPRTKAYGALTLRLAMLGTPHIAFRVKPGAFTPPPSVDSAVVVIEPHSAPPVESPELRAAFADVVTQGFSTRRKTLRNALKGRYGAELASRAISAAGLSPQARAEELSFDDFVRLASATEAEQEADEG